MLMLEGQQKVLFHSSFEKKGPIKQDISIVKLNISLISQSRRLKSLENSKIIHLYTPNCNNVVLEKLKRKKPKRI